MKDTNKHSNRNYMKNIFYTLCILGLIALGACTNKQQDATESVEGQNSQVEKTDIAGSTSNIVGRKIKIEYPTMIAEITYTSDSTLHWKTEEGGIVAEGNENVTYKPIGKDLYFINWIESDGITVSQVVDFSQNIVSVFMSYSDPNSNRGQRSGDLFEGKITVLNE